MDRSDYVLVWINKGITDYTNTVGYCSLCRVYYKGTHCPLLV